MRHTLALLLTDGLGRSGLFGALLPTGLAPMLLGLACAVPCGLLLADGVSRITAENMGVPYFGLKLWPGHFAVALAACAVIALVSALVSLSFVSRCSILEMRRKSRTRKGGIVADIVVTALCSGAAMCLVAVMLLYKDSLAGVRQELLFERWSFDAQVIYSGLVPASQLEYLAGSPQVEKSEAVLLGTATLRYNGSSLDVSGIGIPESGSLMRFTDEDGNELCAEENKIILAQGTASALGVQAGELVDVDAYYGGTLISVRCLVAGISRQYSAFTQIVSSDTVEQYLDSSGVMNSALVRVSGDMQEFLAFAASLPNVYAVQTRESAIQRFDSRFSGTQRLIALVIADGVLLGFSICLLMGYSMWRRNLKRNTVLIMLGESPLRLALRDALWRTCGMGIGLVAALPASAALIRLMLRRLSADTISYPFVFGPRTIALSVALTICYIAAAAVFYYRLCKKYARF